jgi:hypothetical protein
MKGRSGSLYPEPARVHTDHRVYLDLWPIPREDVDVPFVGVNVDAAIRPERA